MTFLPGYVNVCVRVALCMCSHVLEVLCIYMSVFQNVYRNTRRVWVGGSGGGHVYERVWVDLKVYGHVNRHIHVISGYESNV